MNRSPTPKAVAGPRPAEPVAGRLEPADSFSPSTPVVGVVVAAVGVGVAVAVAVGETEAVGVGVDVEVGQGAPFGYSWPLSPFGPLPAGNVIVGGTCVPRNASSWYGPHEGTCTCSTRRLVPAAMV